MKFVVPYDFTHITKTALDHAIMLSKSFPGEIELLHIVPTESKRAKAELQLDKLKDEIKLADDSTLACKVRVGSILEDINKEANEGHAQLIVMGTHGQHGLQHILGSNAIRIVTNSKTPFIITQEKGPGERIKDMVLPVDLNKESMQVLKFASLAAKKFQAKVHVVCKPEDDEFLKKKLSNNILQARQYLDKENIDHEVHLLEGKKSLHDEVINYAEEIGADLVAIAHYPKGLLPQFDTFSQHIITNEPKIPVMIVNTSEVTGVRSQYSFIGI